MTDMLSRGEKLPVDFFQEDPGKTFPILEVVVKHPDVDAGAARDLPDAQAAETRLREHGAGGGDELTVEVGGGPGHN